MNMTQQKQDGFTILGLLVVLIIIGILATAIGIPALSTSFNKGRAGVTIREVLTLVDASSNYLSDEDKWPDQANDCASFLTVLKNKKYVAGIGLSPWSTPYTVSCDHTDPKTITISVKADNARWARYIARGLPAGQVGGPGNRTAQATIPRSLVLQAAANPGGLKDAQVATNSPYGNAQGFPDNRIYKPDCSTGYKPKIYAAISGFSEGATSHAVGSVYVEVASQTSEYWVLKGSIATSAGNNAPPDSRMQMIAITRCEKE